MRDYSRLCKYSIAILVNCNMSASYDAMKTIPCNLKDSHLGHEILTSKSDKSREKLTVTSYSKFTMMAGHYNVKIYNLVKKLYGNSKEIVFTWMRDPLAMLIRLVR